jgi:hypothetical protein
MKKIVLSLALCIGFVLASNAQEKKPKFGIKFTGYVKTDIYFDSRQTVSIRDGQFLLYPKNELPDMNDEDINAKSSFNMLSIQSRIRLNITGPDAFGAKTSGAIEGEFFGHAAGQINEFRLRHAFVKLDWTNTQLLVGQYWHPLFVTGCYPGTVSFNTGAPFTPFTRNPQIRLTQKFNDLKVMFSVITQRDFVSNGPLGPGTRYLRNSVLPALNLRLEYGVSNQEKGTQFLAGISGNYKMLTPRIVTPEDYKTNNTVSSFAAIGYVKYVFKPVTVKLFGTYAGDTYNLTMIGGYAVENIADTVTGFEDYTPIKTFAIWAEIHTNKKKYQIGLFAGYSKNLGAGKDVTGPYFARGSNIGYAYRISPRFIYNVGKFRIAPELEYTVAGYGTTQADGTVTDISAVGNFRVLLGVYFFF